MLSLSDEEEDYLDDEKRVQIDKLISSYQSAVSFEDQSKTKSGNFDPCSNGNSSSDVIDKLRDQFIQQCFCCLICIEHVLKDQAVWSCRSCRSSYHLQCIQRWANENVAKCSLQEQHWEHGNENSKLPSFKWHCPKCRFEYAFREIPKDYRCFCGKVQNPKPDPWLLPHSCGAVCKRSFACGHQCLMLCHPGQCPPCPKIVESPCFCGKAQPKTNRCYLSSWSCNKPCGKVLACGLHRCALKCHEGPCNACKETFERKCACGKQTSVRPCVERIAWSCATPCGKRLTCGKHTCATICHAKNCPPCAESNAARCCPCGKMKYDTEVDCLDDLKCCGDTCGKIMNCGVHRCVERCHKGPCGSCSQTRVKRCRCGAKEKEFTCGKEYLCEIKCKEKRDCGKHLCNRKCCPGGPEFPPSPCELICQKNLQCGNHKCAQPCHSGPCYPCTLTQEVKCCCGKTKLKVPCGEERRVKPPKCKRLCDTRPVCKHNCRTPHKCHFGDCPPCKQTCNLKLKCGHQCPVTCHKGLLVDVNKSALKKSSTPWDKPQPKFELVDEPCPPCEFPIPVGCFGGHVTENVPCYRAVAFDCGRSCGLLLTCGNHECSLPCHAKDEACETCHEKCSLPRSRDCSHSCPLACHPAPCPSCRLMVRVLCHCKLNEKLIPCQEWCQAEVEKRRELSSCGNQCPKVLPCGHTCTKSCHLGDCSSMESCTKRIQVKCPCGQKTSKTQCYLRQKMQNETFCDDECEKLKLEKERNGKISNFAPLEAKTVYVESMDVNQVLLTRRKRKKKLRNASENEDSKSFYEKIYHSSIFKYSFVALALGCCAFFVYSLIFNV